MAISMRCLKCKKVFKIKDKVSKCTGCGTNLKPPSAKAFIARVKLPDGRWKNKQVSSYDIAVKVEAKFKTQAVEEDVFNIKRAPLIDDIWAKYLENKNCYLIFCQNDQSGFYLRLLKLVRGLEKIEHIKNNFPPTKAAGMAFGK